MAGETKQNLEATNARLIVQMQDATYSTLKSDEILPHQTQKIKPADLADNKMFRQSEASHFRVIRTATTNPLSNSKILPHQSQKVNDQIQKITTEADADTLINNTQKSIKINGIDPKHSYKRLHGEQKARATEYRANMNAKERIKESYTDTLKRVEGEVPEPIVKYRDNVAMSEALENRYLDKDGRVIESQLLKSAKVLPKPINDFKTWKNQFSYDLGKAYIQTPINKLYLSPSKSYNHLTNNTYFKDRKEISGAFVEVFKDPLLIVRQDYPSRPSRQNMTDYSHSAKSTKNSTMESQDNSSISNSIVFYKPFKTPNGNLHLAGFAIDKNGELLNTTFYEYSHLGKIAKLIKAKKADVLYDKLASFETKTNKMMSVGEPADIRLTQVNANKQTSNSSLLNEILPNHSQKVKPADLTGNQLKGEYIKQKLESDTPHSMLYEADDIFYE